MRDIPPLGKWPDELKNNKSCDTEIHCLYNDSLANNGCGHYDHRPNAKPFQCARCGKMWCSPCWMMRDCNPIYPYLGDGQCCASCQYYARYRR